MNTHETKNNTCDGFLFHGMVVLRIATFFIQSKFPLTKTHTHTAVWLYRYFIYLYLNDSVLIRFLLLCLSCLMQIKRDFRMRRDDILKDHSEAQNNIYQRKSVRVIELHMKMLERTKLNNVVRLML